MARVLMINPSMRELYTISKVKSSVPNYFPLNLLTIAAPLIRNKHEVKLLDLNFYTNIEDALVKTLRSFNPDYAAVTFTTPLYSQSLRIASIIKKHNQRIVVIAGGVHVTSDVLKTMKESAIDIAVIGEGDFKLLEIVENKNKGRILDIAYKKGKTVIINKRGPLLDNLDKIPFPATELISIDKYQIPYTYCKKNPVFPLETSRGCVYGCVYCNKSVFGRRFRVKSISRVIKDLKKIKELGFKEVHIIDDGFTTDMARAKEICRRIIKEGIKLHFNCPNGIRADKVDYELLRLMKKAGFYRVAFGVETGSQEIMDNINKSLKLDGLMKVFRLCRKAGIETTAFFMFGLPGEKEEDIKKTIRFAKKLNPDIAKFDIMIPLPSTAIFEEWLKKGHITSTNWDDYGFYKEKRVYNHPYLSWKQLSEYLNLAYRKFYISPAFITRRVCKSLKDRTIIEDIKTFLSVRW